MEDRYSIKHVMEHYELYINDVFYSSHDSFTEAAKELDDILNKREEQAV